MARVPKLRRQRRKEGADQAFVEINAERIYLGLWDDPVLPQKYARVLAGERRVPTDLTVVELCARFMEHARKHYRRADGTPTGAADAYHYALRPLEHLYGGCEVRDFGPQDLKILREYMLGQGNSRKYANDRVNRIKTAFKWGVSEGMVPTSVYEGLRTVQGLRAGYQGARENPKVEPVPPADIDAVKVAVRPQVADLINLQLYTGMRSGELVSMRRGDLDLSTDPWEYGPPQHKTAHHGRGRAIFLGPKTQHILRPYLLLPEDVPLFGYSTASYRKAIHRACKRVGVTAWHPHQLRHNAATELRRQFGLEVARLILGHATIEMSAHYAEADVSKARTAMKKFG